MNFLPSLCFPAACFSWAHAFQGKWRGIAGQWELHVLGKNGVTLHGILLTPEHPPHPLKSQDMIQIAEKQFHFLLPKNPQW